MYLSGAEQDALHDVQKAIDSTNGLVNLEFRQQLRVTQDVAFYQHLYITQADFMRMVVEMFNRYCRGWRAAKESKPWIQAIAALFGNTVTTSAYQTPPWLLVKLVEACKMSQPVTVQVRRFVGKVYALDHLPNTLMCVRRNNCVSWAACM